MISTLLRSAHTPSCSRAAARKVSAAASRTDAPESAKCLVSLPIEVVLPAPLTPAIIMTVGLYWPTTSGFCSGKSRAAKASARSALTAAGSVVLLSLTRRLRSTSKYSVAATPASLISKADSSSSYSASSIWVPVNTVAIELPVLRKPFFSLLSQPWRAGAGGGVNADKVLDCCALMALPPTAFAAAAAGALGLSAELSAGLGLGVPRGVGSGTPTVVGGATSGAFLRKNENIW